MPIYKIHHVTRYEYDAPVRESVNEIRLFPYICKEQETLRHDIVITGSPKVEIYTDYWKNITGSFNLLYAHQLMTIESKLFIQTKLSPGFSINFESGFEMLERETASNMQLMELSLPEQIVLTDIITQIISTAPSVQSVAKVVEYFSGYIFKNFKYVKDVTNAGTTVDDVLKHMGGVCQDFAHVLLQILRILHIPARYVSGYICPNKNGMRGEGATHAWVEAWIPEQGWTGIDPTNNTWVSNAHVKLAVGRHFQDCTPAKGTFKGPAKQTLSVYVSVGYEDGHIFEELHNVNMEVQTSDAPEKTELPDYSAQQQQQQ
ncbi:MAG: transglutaminase family protein [Agriterribacter sp.]